MVMFKFLFKSRLYRSLHMFMNLLSYFQLHE